jgi:hypothetical protein
VACAPLSDRITARRELKRTGKEAVMVQCRISGSLSGDYESCRLLGYSAVQSAPTVR